MPTSLLCPLNSQTEYEALKVSKLDLCFFLKTLTCQFECFQGQVIPYSTPVDQRGTGKIGVGQEFMISMILLFS